MRSLLVLILVALPRLAVGQQNIVGTYRAYTAGGQGCTVEVGDARRDSVRVQLDCRRGDPSHHSGGMDARLLLRDGVAVDEIRDNGGLCTLRFEFKNKRVTVRQTGSDLFCGFGFGVSAIGTYPRVSRRPPKFDLLPV